MQIDKLPKKKGDDNVIGVGSYTSAVSRTAQKIIQ